MNLIEEKIKNIIKETVENEGFFLIELILRGNEKNRIIELYIDHEKDVSADDCASLSREINAKLEPLIESAYRLDVSSPGVDRPLKYLRQYPKHINRSFEISYSEPEPDGTPGNTKKLSGKLISVEDPYLVFLVNKSEKRLNFNNIKKAKVIISFS